MSESRDGGARTIRVLLDDVHPGARRSLQQLLEAETGFEVALGAADLAAVERWVEAHPPDVLVLELRTPLADRLAVIQRLRTRVPATQIVTTALDPVRQLATHALAAGALGFVLKETAECELPAAVRAAARGEVFISPRLETQPNHGSVLLRG